MQIDVVSISKAFADFCILCLYVCQIYYMPIHTYQLLKRQKKKKKKKKQTTKFTATNFNLEFKVLKANSVDLDEAAHNELPHQALSCL